MISLLHLRTHGTASKETSHGNNSQRARLRIFSTALEEVSLLWSFLTLGGVLSVACQGFLVREACVGVLVGGAGFLLSVLQCDV